ncbi:MAG: hypothetical protein AAGF53_10270 [Pseudomonadota bacterium]
MTHANQPWQSQLEGNKEPWRAGTPILVLCASLWIWFLSLGLRFLPNEAGNAYWSWLGLAALWLVAQTALARNHAPEKYTGYFSTILQAAIPTAATLVAVFASQDSMIAVRAIAEQASILELIAIHILRLAAWGTIEKYINKQLPRYFFIFGSAPDFFFAISAVVLTTVIWAGLYIPREIIVLGWSFLGIVVFLGAACTMYWGVPKGVFAFRWKCVEAGLEPPTLLPFRWPMNLAPAFCAPMFWLAHALMIFKILG